MVDNTLDDSVSPLVIFFVNLVLYLRDLGNRVAGKIHSMKISHFYVDVATSLKTDIPVIMVG